MGGPKRVILHIGLLKTGTTSLQAFLRENEEELATQGIGYYQMKFYGYNTSSNAGFLCWSALFEARGTVPEEWSYDDEKAAFSEYAKAYDSLILSEECMSEQVLRYPSYWDVVKKNVLEMAGEDAVIDVIIFLRRQDDWILSRWKQSIRSPFYREDAASVEMFDFSEFLDKKAKATGLLDYEAALGRLVKVFGHDHVTVCGYGRTDGEPFDTIGTFLAAAGISLPNADANEAEHRNPSLTMRAAKALLFIHQNKITKGICRVRIRHAAETFSLLYPEKQRYYPLNREMRRHLLSEFEEANERVSKAFNQGIPLFTSEIEDYCEWHDDPMQTKEDAETILKLASLSGETTMLLLREARKS